MREYLPSKQFVARLIILGGILLLCLGIYKIALFLKDRHTGNLVKKLDIQPDVIQKDTNKNGIPDWEESLWGLDPTKNGDSNKEFILAKRQEIAKDNGMPVDDNQPLTENETLSREFFAVVMSLQQSGNLDEASLKAVSDTIGKKIVADPIPDTYTKNSLQIGQTQEVYFSKIKDLLIKYKDKDIGNELTFLSVGLQNNDPGAFDQVKKVASLYKSFGKELIAIPVPTTLTTIDLDLANNYDKTGQTLDGLSQTLEDPIVGMKSLINYKKYSDALVDDYQKLSDISLQK